MEIDRESITLYPKQARELASSSALEGFIEEDPKTKCSFEANNLMCDLKTEVSLIEIDLNGIEITLTQGPVDESKFGLLISTVNGQESGERLATVYPQDEEKDHCTMVALGTAPGWTGRQDADGLKLIGTEQEAQSALTHNINLDGDTLEIITNEQLIKDIRLLVHTKGEYISDTVRELLGHDPTVIAALEKNNEERRLDEQQAIELSTKYNARNTPLSLLRSATTSILLEKTEEHTPVNTTSHGELFDHNNTTIRKTKITPTSVMVETRKPNHPNKYSARLITSEFNINDLLNPSRSYEDLAKTEQQAARDVRNALAELGHRQIVKTVDMSEVKKHEVARIFAKTSILETVSDHNQDEWHSGLYKLPEILTDAESDIACRHMLNLAMRTLEDPEKPYTAQNASEVISLLITAWVNNKRLAYGDVAVSLGKLDFKIRGAVIDAGIVLLSGVNYLSGDITLNNNSSLAQNSWNANLLGNSTGHQGLTVSGGLSIFAYSEDLGDVTVRESHSAFHGAKGLVGCHAIDTSLAFTNAKGVNNCTATDCDQAFENAEIVGPIAAIRTENVLRNAYTALGRKPVNVAVTQGTNILGADSTDTIRVKDAGNDPYILTGSKVPPKIKFRKNVKENGRFRITPLSVPSDSVSVFEKES